MTFDQFTTRVRDHIDAQWVTKVSDPDDVPPMICFCLNVAGPSLLVQPIPRVFFGSREGKDLLARQLGVVVRRDRPAFAAFVCGMKYTVVNAGDMTEEQLRQVVGNQVPDGMTPPLYDTTAREVLQVVMFAPDATRSYTREITRNAIGAAQWGEWEAFERPSGLMIEPLQQAMRATK